ncbi:MAG: hypothetical protein WBO71_12875, partial [Thermoanaerobaculia bacterium]
AGERPADQGEPDLSPGCREAASVGISVARPAVRPARHSLRNSQQLLPVGRRMTVLNSALTRACPKEAA